MHLGTIPGPGGQVRERVLPYIIQCIVCVCDGGRPRQESVPARRGGDGEVTGHRAGAGEVLQVFLVTIVCVDPSPSSLHSLYPPYPGPGPGHSSASIKRGQKD